jgi:hypothetical protein
MAENRGFPQNVASKLMAEGCKSTTFACAEGKSGWLARQRLVPPPGGDAVRTENACQPGR